jgi:hypothetical protein
VGKFTFQTHLPSNPPRRVHPTNWSSSLAIAGAGTPITSITLLLKASKRITFTIILTHGSSNACPCLCHCIRLVPPPSSLYRTINTLRSLHKCRLPSTIKWNSSHTPNDNPNGTDDSDVRLAVLFEGLLITAVVVVKTAQSPRHVPSP